MDIEGPARARGVTLKGCTHGAGEQICIKAIVLCEHIDIEEVPHAAVDLTQYDHGMQLLSNCGLRTIRAQASLRKLKQPRIREPLWLRDDCVADSDIHLHMKSSVAKTCLNCCA